ncbi:MAG: hypothetical protein EXR26_04710 [Nitrosomonadaceae bacterium]|nr:hypothetical protein [Nitrosomonadaceae bacterium]
MTLINEKDWGAPHTQVPRKLAAAAKFVPPIELVLRGLSGVRQRQPRQWSARCPAHDDRGPSLSVRETSDEAVLLHCFAGCTVHDITALLGLDMADLYPPRDSRPGEPRRPPRLLTPGQALELLRQEAILTVVAASNLSQGIALTELDRARLLTVVGRIEYLCVESLGVRHD